MSKPIIQVQDLSFNIVNDERLAIDGLSTTIYEGEWLIIGHNGSGKSTFSNYW